MLRFDSLDDVQLYFFRRLLEIGGAAAPRGMQTKELLAVSFELANPRSRCSGHPLRRWSLPAALGEMWWNLAGSNDLDFLSFYIPRWREYSDDARLVRGSCYGRRLFSRIGQEPSQWERLLSLLGHDKESRRAVVTFTDDQTAIRADLMDVPCASTLQFLVRGGRLHAIATMRSNDVMWGLPYDVFFFTMLQEWLAVLLGVGLGTYHHQAASLHIYERHLARAASIVGAPEAVTAFEMPAMTPPDVPLLLRIEERLRNTGPHSPPPSLDAVDKYWRELLEVLAWHCAVRHAGATHRDSALPLANPYRPIIALAPA